MPAKKTFYLQSGSLDWALQHILRFYDSDFYPKPFEFEAIKSDWANVKAHLLSIDLTTYIPKTPISELAPKFSGSFRIVHQLEPLDSLLYTALIYENAALIESFRVPEGENKSLSYRLKPMPTGTFFAQEHTGYAEFLAAADKMTAPSLRGVVLICDIVDFYNQIYLHRVNNTLEEAKSSANEVIETFLSGLNTNISRGIPVGPAASIAVAELIMADIDKFILTKTNRFVQYVDDVYIYFSNDITATLFLHDLCRYLYDVHRLVLSPDKTKIITVSEFRRNYLKEEGRQEQEAIDASLEKLGKYPAAEEDIDFDSLDSPEQFKVRSQAYLSMFETMMTSPSVDFGLLRHILRQAGKYKVRNIIPKIFENFRVLLPVIREVVIYFQRVLDKKSVKAYEKNFQEWLNSRFLEIPFINIWVFTLFQGDVFNHIALPIDYASIQRVREKALIARRENNSTWVKTYKNKLDNFSPWDKRAIIYAASILSKDEMSHWLGLELSKGDVLNKALCSMLIAKKKSRT